MHLTPKEKLAQSASALGAGILGVGIGTKWGDMIFDYAIVIIIVGAIIHLYGMYIIQMKATTVRTTRIAIILCISAWICLLALLALFVYMAVK